MWVGYRILEDDQACYGPCAQRVEGRMITLLNASKLDSEAHLNVEFLTNLLWGLAFDLFRDSMARDVQQALDVEVIGSQDELEELSVVHIHELLVEVFHLSSAQARQTH
jgi:hypothetical protein